MPCWMKAALQRCIKLDSLIREVDHLHPNATILSLKILV